MPTPEQPTEAEFLQHVREHRMQVLRDDGVHRHVIFRKPNSGDRRFELITWPGYLCYCGDMGSFVFCRLTDMFEFFRGKRDDGALYINPGYWSEKLEAIDRSDGLRQFSEDVYTQQINDWLDGRDADEGLRAAVQEQLLEWLPENESEACRRMSDFSHTTEDGKRIDMDDYCEITVTEYTYRFIWCCYALNWGVRQYDAAKQPAAQEALHVPV